MYAYQVADNSLYYNNYQDPYNQGYYDYTAEDQSLFPSQEADRYLHDGYDEMETLHSKSKDC